MAAWKVSGDAIDSQAFLRQQSLFSQVFGVMAHVRLMRDPGVDWSSWCDQKQIDLFQTPLDAIVDVLADVFEKSLQYSTMNLCRSALSAFNPEVNGYKVGQHPVV